MVSVSVQVGRNVTVYKERWDARKVAFTFANGTITPANPEF